MLKKIRRYLTRTKGNILLDLKLYRALSNFRSVDKYIIPERLFRITERLPEDFRTGNHHISKAFKTGNVNLIGLIWKRLPEDFVPDSEHLSAAFKTDKLHLINEVWERLLEDFEANRNHLSEAVSIGNENLINRILERLPGDFRADFQDLINTLNSISINREININFAIKVWKMLPEDFVPDSEQLSEILNYTHPISKPEKFG